MADLTLRIKRYWFDSILIGKKRVEYRDLTQYYRKRIEGKNIKRMVLLPGYSKDIPVLLVDVKRIIVNQAKKQYEIHIDSKKALWFDNVKLYKDFKQLEELEKIENAIKKKKR